MTSAQISSPKHPLLPLTNGQELYTASNC